MQDNFNLVTNLLDFENERSFYFIQILKRRKENPEMKQNVRVINNYYVYSKEDLEKIKSRIVEDCEKHNARAYINLNRLDTEKIALYTLKITTDYIIQGDYKAVKNAYSTACGSHHSEKNKRWVVDIDENALHLKASIRKVIEELHDEIKGNKYKILEEIPTRSGIHLITNPFNMQKFRELMLEMGKSDENYIGIDVHKNSPTILYL
jgi:hypothetical protein